VQDCPVPAVNWLLVIHKESVMYFIAIGIEVLVVMLAVIGLALLSSLVRVVTVQEATAVAFKYLGRFVYCAMEFTGHSFDLDGSIVTGCGPNSYGSCWCIWRWGGWVFYIYPLVKPTNYTEQNNADGFGEGICVHLGDITPEPFVAEAETASPDNVGLNIKFVSTMRVVSPYRWLFPSPKDVNAQVVKRQDSVLRAWVRSGDQNHAQAARGNGVQLWSDLVTLNCKPVFDKIESDWGLKILENSIIVEDVGYDPTYQDALKAKSQAKLQVEASVEETAGRIRLSVATELGLTVDELKEKLKDPNFSSSAAYKDALSFAKDMLKRDRAGDKGELRDVRVSNGDGTSIADQTVGLLLGGLAAAAGKFGNDGGKQDKRRKSNKGSSKENDQPASSGLNEKTAQEFFNKYKVYPPWDPLHRTPVGDGT
jgi:hypothetical protein